MVFSENTYSVLVVTASQKIRDALGAMLPYSEYYPVCFAGSIAEARRELVARHFDFVIVNPPLPDDMGVRFAIDTSEKPDCVVLLLLKGETYEQVNARVQPYGVFTIQLPVGTQTLKQGLKWMSAARERLRRLETKTLTVEEKMEEIRVVNRAKWLLIEKQNMTESEAHHLIEKQAMDGCLTKKEVASAIIHQYT